MGFLIYTLQPIPRKIKMMQSDIYNYGNMLNPVEKYYIWYKSAPNLS